MNVGAARAFILMRPDCNWDRRCNLAEMQAAGAVMVAEVDRLTAEMAALRARCRHGAHAFVLTDGDEAIGDHCCLVCGEPWATAGKVPA